MNPLKIQILFTKIEKSKISIIVVKIKTLFNMKIVQKKIPVRNKIIQDLLLGKNTIELVWDLSTQNSRIKIKISNFKKDNNINLTIFILIKVLKVAKIIN